jgi:membrane-bound lytic murein transglycosylase D
MKLHRPLLPILIVILSSIACATATSKAERTDDPTEEHLKHELSRADDEALHHMLHRFDADGPLDPRLSDRVAFYLGKLRQKDLAAIEQRRVAVWPTISRELKEKSLPEALGAITYVESHFNPGVRGGNDCAGLWQFIPQTARREGLKIEGEVDERLSPEKSSRAAASFLSALMGEFKSDDFLLAIAAYNGGENAVRAALASSVNAGGEAPKSFWTLERRGLLSAETLHYVPQVLAAAIALLPADAR